MLKIQSLKPKTLTFIFNKKKDMFKLYNVILVPFFFSIQKINK